MDRRSAHARFRQFRSPAPRDTEQGAHPGRPSPYVLSAAGWVDTRAGVRRIRWLGEHAVPTIHLSIGIAPLLVECDRITVMTDPADARPDRRRHRRRAARAPAPGDR